LQCSANATPDCGCLTQKEVAAVRKVWDGPRSSDGNRLWYGMTRGTPTAALSGANPFSISADHFRYWVERDKTFDWHKLDYASFEASFQKSRALLNRVIGSDDPDLRAFRREGGKVLMWHGLSDQIDMFGDLVKWVESGLAPERIVASRTQNNQVVRSRPLCVYPQIAKYTGTGSTDDAKNFTCEMPFEYGSRWIK
jgi:hypothetical protein